MINTLDKKINALAARHSWHISPRAGDGGTQEQAKAAQLLRAHELDAMQAYAKLYA